MKIPTLITLLLLTSCGVVATMTIDPVTKDGQQVITYRGPKDVDLSFEKGGIKAKYSGKIAPWWHGMMPLLMRSVPDVTVVK